MDLLLLLTVGIFAGVVARRMVPWASGYGLDASVPAGVLGALVGALVGHLIGYRGGDPPLLVTSSLGAVSLSVIRGALSERRAKHLWDAAGAVPIPVFHAPPALDLAGPAPRRVAWSNPAGDRMERRLLLRPHEGGFAMANLTVNKAPAKPAYPATSWDPFSVFRDFIRWDPFREIAPMSSVDRMAELDAPFEIKETKEGYLFKADVPGIKENDITINLTGSRLTVSGKREEEKRQEHETYFSYERSYGSFTRSFTLPDGVDGEKVSANLKEGVLSILVPKKPEAQPKKVEIKGG
jgi:HSP20 family protein